MSVRSRGVACAAAALTIPALVAVWTLAPDRASAVAAPIHGVSVLIAAAAMVVASRSGDPRLRRSRRLFAAALGASAIGFAISSVYEAVFGYIPVPSLADAAALAWVPCAVAGLIFLPTEQHREGGRLRVLCDAAVAGSALMLCSWMLVLKPIYETVDQPVLVKATFLAYPVVDIIVAVSALSVATHARHDMRRLLRWVTAGLILIAVNDSGNAMNVASDNLGFSWTNIVLQAGLVCVFFAAVLPPKADGRENRTVDAVMDAALPFLPVVVTTVVGLNYIISGHPFAVTEGVIAAVMIAGLLGRQLLYARHVGAIAYRMSVDAAEDPLTGLANRRAFLNVLDTALLSYPPGRVAVAILDLDGFKEINDSFGHAAGDAALVDFAERVRHAAGGRARAARLGGDEFALLVTGDEAELAAITAAHELTDVRGARIGTAHVSFGASAGIAVTRAGDSTSNVLRRADLAMYDAKRTQSRAAVFTDGMACRAERRHLLMRALPGAAERGELHLVYQPLYRLDDSAIAGVETLLRWRHPLHGDVPPDEFIPLAEEIGAMPELGDWVLSTVLRQMHDWHTMGRSLPHLFVNVSAHQFTATFTSTTLGMLQRHGIDPASLTLEITESALPDLSANRALRELRAAGIRIAMDDFGAGFSSLAQLAMLPVDTLKFDRDFIRGIHGDDGRRIVHAMIKLAGELGLSTVAEGIEHASEAEIVAAAGCALAQGYHFARPMPAAEVVRLLPPATQAEGSSRAAAAGVRDAVTPAGRGA